MADLAKLVVKLEAENAKLHRDLERSQAKLTGFEKHTKKSTESLKALKTAGALVGAAVVASLGAMTSKALDMADKVGKLSQSTGLTTETLSRLDYMAKLTGGSFDEMTKGVKTLQRAMYDTDRGLATQSEAFDSIGVSVTDNTGKLKDTEVVMMEVAEQFKNMEDGAKKSALAQVLFGRAGLKMIPFLNMGRDGIREMAEEADALGITMDGKLTSAAERTNDNLTRLSTAAQGIFLRVLEQAMPMLENVTKAMVAWAKDTDNVNGALTFLSNLMKIVATGATVVKSVFNSLGKVVGGVAAAVVLSVKGDFSAAGEALSMSFEDARESMTDDMLFIEQIWKDVPARVEQGAKQTGKALAAPVIEAEGAVERSVTQMQSKLKELEKSYQKALTDSEKIAQDFQKRFNDVTTTQTPAAEAGVLDVGFLELQAQQAIDAGNIDQAIDKLNRGFDILDAMKESGSESSLVIEGMADALKRVADEAAKTKLDQAVNKIQLEFAEDPALVAMRGTEQMQKALDGSPLKQLVELEYKQPDNIEARAQQIANTPNPLVSNQAPAAAAAQQEIPSLGSMTLELKTPTERIAGEIFGEPVFLRGLKDFFQRQTTDAARQAVS